MAAEEALLKRVLPQNMEAEQAVVGSMIMDKEAISVASEMLTGDDFYSKQYGVVFDTMVELNDQGKAVDPVTLQDRLRAKDVPPEMVSLDFIRDIMRSVTTSANVKYYAGIVAEKSTLRKLIRLNQEIENTCYAGKEDLEVILESTEKKVFELVQKRNTGEYVPIRQVVMNAMDRIDAVIIVIGTPWKHSGMPLQFSSFSLSPAKRTIASRKPRPAPMEQNRDST